MTRFALGLLLLLPACDEAEPLCPTGWRGEDSGLCSPPERAYDEFPGSTGVFGYVKTRECTAHCDDVVEELRTQRVVVFEAGGCDYDSELGWESDPTEDPACAEHLVAETETDDEGVFEIVLPPGDDLVATDTVVFDAWDGSPVTVADGFPQFVDFYFDAVPI